jgi:hypothetical protein
VIIGDETSEIKRYQVREEIKRRGGGKGGETQSEQKQKERKKKS